MPLCYAAYILLERSGWAVTQFSEMQKAVASNPPCVDYSPRYPETVQKKRCLGKNVNMERANGALSLMFCYAPFD